MSLDRLVEEIRARGQAELAAIAASTKTETDRIAAESARRIAEIGSEAERVATQEATRERALRIAAAKLRARQKVYEARETRLKQSLAETRSLLAEFTRSPQYPAVLTRMLRTAQSELGAGLRVRGRAEDAATLAQIAGAAFEPTPVPILGGIWASSADGRRDLNLSFNELLRLREDRVREILG